MRIIDDLYNILKVILDFIRMKPYEIIVFWIIGLALIFLSGMCLVKLCRLEEKTELYYMAGCILAVSVSHVTASIMESLRMTFSMFKTVTLCVYGIIVIAMIITCKKNGRLLTEGSPKKYLMNFVDKFKGYSLLGRVFFIVVAVFCCYIMFNTMCHLTTGASDDGYYVTKIGVMIQDDTLHLTNEQVTNGVVYVPSLIRADASTWCTFLALIASSFSIDYTVTAHVAIVPFILIAAMATISLIAKTMFDSTIPKLLFWISFFMFAITAPYGQTMINDYWIFTYSWYGVTTLYIMIYFLIYYLLTLSKREEYLCKTGFWIFATLAVTASMAMEVVAAYLIPCFLLTFGLPFIAVNRNKISADVIFRISWILLPILHSVIKVLMGYVNMPEYVLRLSGGKYGGFNMDLSSIAAWKANQAVFWGITSKNIYTVLTIVALFCIRDKKIRQFFGWSFLTAVVTFLNPLLYKFICVNISTEIVYYRLYWCIPNLLIIAYCLVERLTEVFIRRKRAVLAYIVFIVYIVGFRQNVYGDRQLWVSNIKKLDKEYVYVAESLLTFRGQNEKIYALVPREYCDYVRQYSLDIVYPLGKRSPAGPKMPGSDLSYLNLYAKVYSLNENLGELSDEDVDIIKSLGTQVIVFRYENEIPEVLQAYDDAIDEHNYHYILLQ